MNNFGNGMMPNPAQQNTFATGNDGMGMMPSATMQVPNNMGTGVGMMPNPNGTLVGDTMLSTDFNQLDITQYDTSSYLAQSGMADDGLTVAQLKKLSADELRLLYSRMSMYYNYSILPSVRQCEYCVQYNTRLKEQLAYTLAQYKYRCSRNRPADYELQVNGVKAQMAQCGQNISKAKEMSRPVIARAKAHERYLQRIQNALQFVSTRDNYVSEQDRQYATEQYETAKAMLNENLSNTVFRRPESVNTRLMVKTTPEADADLHRIIKGIQNKLIPSAEMQTKWQNEINVANEFFDLSMPTYPARKPLGHNSDFYELFLSVKISCMILQGTSCQSRVLPRSMFTFQKVQQRFTYPLLYPANMRGRNYMLKHACKAQLLDLEAMNTETWNYGTDAKIDVAFCPKCLRVVYYVHKFDTHTHTALDTHINM